MTTLPGQSSISFMTTLPNAAKSGSSPPASSSASSTWRFSPRGHRSTCFFPSVRRQSTAWSIAFAKPPVSKKRSLRRHCGTLSPSIGRTPGRVKTTSWRSWDWPTTRAIAPACSATSNSLPPALAPDPDQALLIAGPQCRLWQEDHAAPAGPRARSASASASSRLASASSW